jgi:Flp pilus assembly CpaE family ATPase
VVLDLARRLAAVTVVDVGFCLERDEELSFDTAAPRRNGAALAALAAADTVVAVGAGDPVGLQRLVRGLAELGEVTPGVAPVVVVNRVRAGAIGGGSPAREISAALDRFAGVPVAVFVPLDVAAYDAAIALGQTLAEAAPGSPARRALSDLAGTLLGAPERSRRRLLRRG